MFLVFLLEQKFMITKRERENLFFSNQAVSAYIHVQRYLQN